jgi:hypothetical protein
MGPREVLARMQQQWLDPIEDDMWAEDVVVETPFALPGRPRRVEGRATIQAMAAAGRAAMPIRFEECTNVAIHETKDPEVIVVEYELAGIVAGRRASAPFIGVLQVRDGKVVRWREYQDAIAIASGLGTLPQLLTELS